LPGDHGANEGLGPRRGGRHPVALEETGRFFMCGRCRTQVLICRCCDRGQIYCAGGCAQLARAERRREAARRYQKSRNGRFVHAARSRRHRARQLLVTHQGSLLAPADACVMTVSAAAQSPSTRVDAACEAPSPSIRQGSGAGLGRHCHWCGRCCSPFVRQDYLRRRRSAWTMPPGG
jgi:hypothetical protein